MVCFLGCLLWCVCWFYNSVVVNFFIFCVLCLCLAIDLSAYRWCFLVVCDGLGCCVMFMIYWLVVLLDLRYLDVILIWCLGVEVCCVVFVCFFAWVFVMFVRSVYFVFCVVLMICLFRV